MLGGSLGIVLSGLFNSCFLDPRYALDVQENTHTTASAFRNANLGPLSVVPSLSVRREKPLRSQYMPNTRSPNRPGAARSVGHLHKPEAQKLPTKTKTSATTDIR